ncbi:PP2C family protein-serine/threonine phosphatase [Nocardioides sp. TF02-7]|uniref:PP2C family protein-serine/threonine phosphatase n=1 Tax=Nocardioides sp. TF02-7 TaxID=2917724 RepID=UPI001F055A4D|nr:PP2C family protein-serine/threonine phosphatase [Nocardioides sp. TF02-7]UMG92466.1 serine/threonine-protein phosphatase [Nocardioides sp. TF02-7]
MDEDLLSGLRDRLQAQSRVPQLPPDWHCESAMLAAYGFEYGGDFFVADLLTHPSGAAGMQMVLVDVCGKGEGAVPDAVQLSGALQGLLVAVPESGLMAAANEFLLRLPCPESFATAVQVVVDFATGRYVVRSAGHPPVLRWRREPGEWVVDSARGTALGVVDRPEMHVSEGVLARGEALLFYTDGVVEARGSDIDTGIAWLQRVAADAVAEGFAAAPGRIIDQVERGDDDRAVLVLVRE